MATATVSNYSAGSGDDAFIGVSPPLWLTSTDANTYAEIPLALTVADINHENDVLINPDFPSTSVWKAVLGKPAMFDAWSGGCFDYFNNEIQIPLGGGHGDYAGNEPYKIDIRSDTPSAVMLRNPSGAIGNEITLDDNQEATGKYSDGRVRSCHTYNKIEFVPDVGAFVSVLGGTYKDDTKSEWTLKIDMVTGEADFLIINPIAGTQDVGIATTYDQSRHGLWVKRTGTTKMMFYDIELNLWDEKALEIGLSGDVGMVYIPVHDVIMIVNPIYTNNFAIYDCATDTVTEPSLTNSFVGMALDGHCQPRYSLELGLIAFWNNTTNTTEMNQMAIPANPKTDTWTVDQFTIDGGNSVTPSVMATNGTYGRFFYSPIYGGFGFINGVEENPYFLKVRT